MNTRGQNSNHLFFNGEIKNNFFKRKQMTKLLIDYNFLWISGYQMKKNKLKKRLSEHKLKYLDIYSIDLSTINDLPAIKITGKKYLSEEILTIYVPYISDMQVALDTITNARESFIQKHKDRQKKLELIHTRKKNFSHSNA